MVLEDENPNPEIVNIFVLTSRIEKEFLKRGIPDPAHAIEVAAGIVQEAISSELSESVMVTIVSKAHRRAVEASEDAAARDQASRREKALEALTEALSTDKVSPDKLLTSLVDVGIL